MADRFAYVPLIGLFVMLVWLAADYAAAVPRRARVIRPMTAVILVACCATARWQLGFWQNTESIFRRTLQVTSDNFVAENVFGGALHQQGKLDEAAAHFKAAVRIRPSAHKLHRNLAVVQL